MKTLTEFLASLALAPTKDPLPPQWSWIARCHDKPVDWGFLSSAPTADSYIQFPARWPGFWDRVEVRTPAGVLAMAMDNPQRWRVEPGDRLTIHPKLGNG